MLLLRPPSIFLPGIVTSATLYNHGVIALDKEVAGFSPTEDVWSWSYREGQSTLVVRCLLFHTGESVTPRAALHI